MLWAVSIIASGVTDEARHLACTERTYTEMQVRVKYLNTEDGVPDAKGS